MEEQHRCTVCGKKCTSASKLRQHSLVHSSSDANVAHEDVQRAAAALGVLNGAEGSATNSGHCEEPAVSEMAPEGQQPDPKPELLEHTLARLRVVHHVPRDSLHVIKTAMMDMVQSVHRDAVDKLPAALAAGVDVEAAIAEVFQGVEESLRKLAIRDGELKHVRGDKSYVQPVKRYLGPRVSTSLNKVVEEFYAYDSPLDETLEAMFASRPDIWADVESFKSRVAKRIRTSEKYDASARIEDMIDGVEFGHFYLRLQLQAGETPLVFIFYYDGLEVVNGLGQARLTHELACFYWALVPINDLEKRLKPENLRLATVCLKRAITHVGMHVVMNGRPEDERKTAWGAQMKTLSSKEGMTIQTPSGKRKFRGGTALVSADTPAGAELFGVKKSVGPSTKSVCKGCHCAQHGEPPPYRQPNSFLSACEGWKRCCAGRRRKFALRSIKDLKDYLQKLLEHHRGELSAADLEAWKQDAGINEIISAMVGCPHISLATGCPMDMMHILLEGTARNLLAAICYVMIRRWGIHEDDIVDEIANFAKENNHKRAKYPYVNSSRASLLKEGTDLGVCKPDCSFPGTAMQVSRPP